MLGHQCHFYRLGLDRIIRCPLHFYRYIKGISCCKSLNLFLTHLDLACYKISYLAESVWAVFRRAKPSGLIQIFFHLIWSEKSANLYLLPLILSCRSDIRPPRLFWGCWAASAPPQVRQGRSLPVSRKIAEHFPRVNCCDPQGYFLLREGDLTGNRLHACCWVQITDQRSFL